MTNIIGLLRVKNESRWIERVVASIRDLCSHVVVFDDHSEDDTATLARAAGATVIHSPFERGMIDEPRDRDCLLDCAFEYGNVGDWALMIDGDEELRRGDDNVLRAVVQSPVCKAYSLRIMYLWNSADQIRVDGVYARFRRPSLFALTDRSLRFRRTKNGGGFHCGSIPGQLCDQPIGALNAQLLHYGYIDAELRAAKFAFYNRIDPNNRSEDGYRHIMQGDPGGVPADAVLMHAGPLRLTRI